MPKISVGKENRMTKINIGIVIKAYTEKYNLLKSTSEMIDAKVTRLGCNTDIENTICDLEKDLTQFNNLFKELKELVLSKV